MASVTRSTTPVFPSDERAGGGKLVRMNTMTYPPRPTGPLERQQAVGFLTPEDHVLPMLILAISREVSADAKDAVTKTKKDVRCCTCASCKA